MRVVIKVGTSLIAPGGQIDINLLRGMVDQFDLSKNEYLIVTSGAIAAGMSGLDLQKRPNDVPRMQACAAVGQSKHGKRQEIRVFAVEDYRPPQPANSRLPAPATPAAPVAPAVPEFSNRNPIEPGAPNAPTVIVIDAGDTWDSRRMTWADLVYARDQLILFLRQVHPEDRLGIYLMSADRFWVLREY